MCERCGINTKSRVLYYPKFFLTRDDDGNIENIGVHREHSDPQYILEEEVLALTEQERWQIALMFLADALEMGNRLDPNINTLDLVNAALKYEARARIQRQLQQVFEQLGVEVNDEAQIEIIHVGEPQPRPLNFDPKMN